MSSACSRLPALGLIRVVIERTLQPIGGLDRAAIAQADDAEHVERVAVIGMTIEHLQTKGVRALVLCLAEAGHGLFEAITNRSGIFHGPRRITAQAVRLMSAVGAGGGDSCHTFVC